MLQGNRLCKGSHEWCGARCLGSLTPKWARTLIPMGPRCLQLAATFPWPPSPEPRLPTPAGLLALPQPCIIPTPSQVEPSDSKGTGAHP